MDDEPVTVLVAEDDPLSRRLLRAILRPPRFTVIEAEDGPEAVRKFAEHGADVVLMDLNLPMMDGMAATAEIKRLAGERFVPILVVTSQNETEVLGRALASGADDYVTKPFDRLLFERKMAAALRTRKLFDRLADQHRELVAQKEQSAVDHRVAQKIASNITGRGCLDAPCLRHWLSPMAVFNGDVLFAAFTGGEDIRIMLGDFTGHGLTAAIGALPVAELFYAAAANGVDLGTLIQQINAKVRAVLPTGLFCAAALFELSQKDGTLRVWNGGSPDLLLRNAAGRVIGRLASEHPPLGVLPTGAFDASLVTAVLAPGQRVCAYSDGVVDHSRADGEMFGEDRLVAFLTEADREGLPLASLRRRVLDFAGQAPRGDDMAIVELLRCHPDAGSLPARPDPAHAEEDPARGMKLAFEFGIESLRCGDAVERVLNALEGLPVMERARSEIFLILSELYSNAVEHGLLGLESSSKDAPGGYEAYYAQRSAGLAALVAGRITIEVTLLPIRTGTHIRVRVTDSGTGFVAGIAAPPSLARRAGRGLALIKGLGAEVTRVAPGNCIVVDLKL